MVRCLFPTIPKGVSWTVLILLSVLLWRGTAVPAGSAGGSISGIIQQAGQGIANHRIMLLRFGPQGEVERMPGHTDSQGRFLFEQLETGRAFTYIVGIRYQGQLYRSEAITLAPGEHRSGVLLRIGQDTARTPALPASEVYIANHLVVVLLQGDHLVVREVVRVVNPGPTAHTGTASTADLPAASLYLPLPQGYYDLRDIQGLAPEHVQLTPSGLYYTAPLAVGQHNVVYTYALPFSKKTTTILSVPSLPTRIVDILVEEQGLAATSDLQFAGHITIDPHSFLHFRGLNLAARSRFWVQLTARGKALSWLRIAGYGLTGGLVLLGIVFPLLHVKLRHHTGAQLAEPLPFSLTTQDRKATRHRLLQTIAHLDRQREAGAIKEEEYQQRRREYKQQLLALERLLRLSPVEYSSNEGKS